ncbi:MAG: PstS family phosphate ABC transporter substrate-binding protein [Rhodospirillaceae bacterium]|nr:MAG: PstS family phosphate ABC transporter substrate-binding protein [Rhodospirillaceae bacterium]
MKRYSLALLAATGLVGLTMGATAAEARDQLHIVGSSTVFPFATAVAEQFGKAGSFKTPVVESTGSGGGIKLFCAGVGDDTPDIANASRKIKDSEIETCKKNGVTAITEVTIGYDGIVLANSKQGPALKLTVQDVWKALAKQVPVDGKLVDNPYKTWQDVNKDLPAEKIEVLGPPTTSGTRDAFVELVMDEGCKDSPEIKAISDAKARTAACGALREDGGYIDAGENDNLIVQKLESNPAALGIFGYSYLEQNADKLQGSLMDGVAPTFENIVSGKYEVSRPLFFYVKNQHADKVPGLREYIAEFVSDKATGQEGYAIDKGLIPLPEDKHKEAAESANALKSMM